MPAEAAVSKALSTAKYLCMLSVQELSSQDVTDASVCMVPLTPHFIMTGGLWQPCEGLTERQQNYCLTWTDVGDQAQWQQQHR